MELWIRSQDKDRIIKVNNIEVVFDVKWEIYGYASDEQYYLGMYATRERALEVLDEIQKYLTPTIQMLDETLKDEQVVQVNSISTFVYEMPKE